MLDTLFRSQNAAILERFRPDPPVLLSGFVGVGREEGREIKEWEGMNYCPVEVEIPMGTPLIGKLAAVIVSA